MSSGKQHNRYNIIATLPFIAIMLFFFKVDFDLITLFTAGVLIGTFLLGPDLDIKSQLYFRWGLYKVIWDVYQKIFSHRSIFSHLPILSDVIRVIFLSSSFFLVFTILNGIDEISKFKISYIVFALLFAIPLIFSKNKRLDLVVSESLITMIFLGLFLLTNDGKFGIEKLFLNWQATCLFLGIIFSTTVHTFADILYSSNKVLKKKKKKGLKAS